MSDTTAPADFELTVTTTAGEKLREALAAEQKEDYAIRVVCRRFGKARFENALDFAAPGEGSSKDVTMELANGVKVWVDPDSARHLSGSTIDYVEGDRETGFKFENPREAEGWDNPIAERFQKLLDEEINPGVASHGGMIEFLDYNEGTAYVKMGGGCQGCGMASVTLRQGIETRVVEVIPEITSIVDTTDHAAGSNPYYAQGK